ncbi:MAG: UDP-N-acetylglucosamine 2-epimerase (non-hydrolyzing) [Deltaproteobacteria bacterium]
MKIRLLLVAGARPNYMKIAPIYWAIRDSRVFREAIEAEIIHTGQHYDAALSDDFFRDLDLPAPAVNLGVGSGSHAEQTAKVMIGFEKVLQEHRADVVLVVGDVNSTAACAMVTAKAYGCTPSGEGRPLLAHVEAGLRSRDLAMPEEVNRLVTDALSDILFTTSGDADENLRAEGVNEDKIERVGNTMIDSLLRSLAAAEQEELPAAMTAAAESGGFGLCTLHRPSNVDDRETLSGILSALSEIAAETPLFLPIHPRTRARIEAFGLGAHLKPATEATENARGIFVIEPLSYLQMLCAQRRSAFVLTDSGGLQEETTVLGIPCVTIRDNTERPITITEGSNVLAGTSRAGILRGLAEAKQKVARGTRTPELWDGQAGERIVAELVQRCSGKKENRAVA